MSINAMIADNTKSISSVANTLANKITIDGPSSLATIGAIGVVVSGIAVGIATFKSRHLIDETKCRAQDFSEYVEEIKKDDTLTFKTKVKKFIKELNNSFAPMILKFAKNYAIPVAFIFITEFAFHRSYKIMVRNEAALAAAYATLNDAFKRYRTNVVKAEGIEKDKQYMQTPQVDEKTVEAYKAISDCNYGYDDFIFDETCDAWDFCSGDVDCSLEYARTYAGIQLAGLNRTLRGRVEYNRDGTVKKPGYIFVNEILSIFKDDLRDHPEGQCTGILYDPTLPWACGEIDFGDMQAIQTEKGNWGIQISIKHDGYILDKIRS